MEITQALSPRQRIYAVEIAHFEGRLYAGSNDGPGWALVKASEPPVPEIEEILGYPGEYRTLRVLLAKVDNLRRPWLDHRGTLFVPVITREGRLTAVL